ncbi:hypothetical protein TNCT_59351 [Trichonephila clavata]|uniref:Uncharacterized protein n=1 Tax=Trichonephila clavata TaxID=2740835 RepID=A0A8X6FP36_TRICU|nr:hypothetical protein TNCT_59351 [Trichonephila clavata]
MGMRGGEDLKKSARCKASQICSIMFMSGELRPKERVRNLEECSSGYLVASVELSGPALSCWKCPRLSKNTRSMNRCRWSERILEFH